MNKIKYLPAILSLVAFSAFADTDKSVYCPPITQIKQNGFTLFAVNDEGVHFSTMNPVCDYCNDVIMQPIEFIPSLSKYDAKHRTLSCVYKVTYRYVNEDIPYDTVLRTLFNFGHY